MYEQEGRNNSPGDLGTKRVKKNFNLRYAE